MPDPSGGFWTEVVKIGGPVVAIVLFGFWLMLKGELVPGYFFRLYSKRQDDEIARLQRIVDSYNLAATRVVSLSEKTLEKLPSP